MYYIYIYVYTYIYNISIYIYIYNIYIHTYIRKLVGSCFLLLFFSIRQSINDDNRCNYFKNHSIDIVRKKIIVFSKICAYKIYVYINVNICIYIFMYM